MPMQLLTPSSRSDGSSSASEVGWSSVAAVMGRCFCSIQEGTFQEAKLDSWPTGCGQGWLSEHGCEGMLRCTCPNSKWPSLQAELIHSLVTLSVVVLPAESCGVPLQLALLLLPAEQCCCRQNLPRSSLTSSKLCAVCPMMLFILGSGFMVNLAATRTLSPACRLLTLQLPGTVFMRSSPADFHLQRDRNQHVTGRLHA